MTRVQIWMGGFDCPVCDIKNPQKVTMNGTTVLIVAENGTRFEAALQNVLMITEEDK